MSKLPTVAIIGRPNTGKSTLFNRIIGERKAIESDIPGTTRDHISHRVELERCSFILIDTGGIGATRDKDFEKDVKEQSLLALEYADIILFTVNTKEDLTADDRTIIEHLRKKRRKHVPVIVVLTKVDAPGTQAQVASNYSDVNAGDEMIAVSAVHRIGVDQLLKSVERELGKLGFAKAMEHGKLNMENIGNESGGSALKIEKVSGKIHEGKIGRQRRSRNIEDNSQLSILNFQLLKPARIAIIGKPNVGKSSIINALTSSGKRMTAPLLVSPIAGTTRDAVDTEVIYHDKPYVLIDTAGLKKHKMSLDEIERFAMMRTITSIETADVVILVVDASEPISHQDKRVAAMAIDSGKGLIVLLNKIDTMKGEKRKQVLAHVDDALHFCTKFTKIIPCSAVTKEGLLKLFDIVESVQLSRTRRLSTRELHRWFEQTVHGKPLGEITRVKHLTQTKDVPPTFVLFMKNPKRVSITQLRYLENRLRETFGFTGTPVRWVMRGEEGEEVRGKN